MLVSLTASGNLLASGSNTDDDALTPTLVGGLESCPHDANVSSAVKGVVATAIGHLNELLDDGLSLQLAGVHEVGCAKLLGPLLLGWVDIDDNNLSSFLRHGALYDGQTNTAGTEDGNVGSLVAVGSDSCSTVTGGNSATKQAGSVHGSILLDRYYGDIRYDCVLGEGRGTHEVQELLALAGESRGAIGHDTLTLGGSDLSTQVGLARLAELALLAFRCAIS